MEWKPTIKNEQGLIKVPKRWLHIHYYEAMNVLFRFENSLRVFVYAILKNEFLDEWQERSFSVAGGDSSTIKALAAKRISQAENFGYLGFDIKAPLMHLTSGELVDLITSDSYWPKFKGCFKGNKEIIKNKLLEIGTIRNSLAHFRPIKPEDVELVKQNSRHTLLGVEECLSNIFIQNLRVPTNTNEEWYKSISTFGTDQISTFPYYSADESWINVTLRFDTPILSKSKHETFCSFMLAKINTPNILLNHQMLTKYLTYVNEKLGYPIMSDAFDIQISKDLNFVFRKDILVKNHEVIATEFKEVLSKITEECDLLSKDYLARGSLVESVRGNSFWNQPEGESGSWRHYYTELLQPYQPRDPEEFWGQDQFTRDVVAGCARYPWMPEDISQVEGFLD